MTHGANPGPVSHFVKQALLNIAADTGRDAAAPATREGWAELARTLGVKVIHIAERDARNADRAKMPGEFVNTWSIDGFVRLDATAGSRRPVHRGHRHQLPLAVGQFPRGVKIWLGR